MLPGRCAPDLVCSAARRRLSSVSIFALLYRAKGKQEAAMLELWHLVQGRKTLTMSLSLVFRENMSMLLSHNPA